MLNKLSRALKPSKLMAVFIFSLMCLAIVFWSRTAAAPMLPQKYTASVTTILIPVTKLTPASQTVSTTPGTSSSLSLQQLASYTQEYNTSGVIRIMKFTDVPDSPQAAQSQAVKMAGALNQYAAEGISPLIIMEPVSDLTGNPINFSAYRNGTYDSILSTYFQTLKNQGITDSTMGMWVYFPEANLPQWGPVDQADFAPNVVKTVHFQKAVFPNSLSSIMLDAESYPAGSTSWSGGSYVSLSPFINGIPGGTIDSFGLQGFPWVPAANVSGEASSINPAVYLNASLASAAAKQLGTQQIWLNTGTFAAAYTNNPSQTITMAPAQRQSILNGVFGQANSLRQAGFGVAVNVFAENKSNTSEATDLSYSVPDDQAVLNSFAAQLQAAGLGFWLFTG